MSKNEPLKVIAGTPDRPLVIGDIEIPCYVLEDETRVLAQRGMMDSLDMKQGTAGRGGGDRLSKFVRTKALMPFISEQLAEVINNPLTFQTQRGSRAYGYPAELLTDLCEAVLAARQANKLHHQQEHIAARCEILVRAFAKLGIVALVDEVTGYQHVREQRALATILEKFIADELQPWSKTFPYEFYRQIFRLKKWPMPSGGKSIKGPRVIGRYTNDIVYDRLAPGVLEELRRLTPKLPNGRRPNKFFQWFTPDSGHPKLKEHLAAVTALMRAAPNWTIFHRNLVRAFPTKEETPELPLEE